MAFSNVLSGTASTLAAAAAEGAGVAALILSATGGGLGASGDIELAFSNVLSGTASTQAMASAQGGGVGALILEATGAGRVDAEGGGVGELVLSATGSGLGSSQDVPLVYSNVLAGTASTDQALVGEGAGIGLLVLSAAGEGFAPLVFSISIPGAFQDGETVRITAANAPDLAEATVFWSPSNDHTDADAVALTVVDRDTAWIDVTAQKGVTRIGDQGWLIVVASEIASTQVTLAVRVGWDSIVLVDPPLLWAEGVSVTAGDLRWWWDIAGSNGRLYEADETGTTGDTPPVHDEGSQSDNGVDWTFVREFAGIRVTSDVATGGMRAWEAQGGDVEVYADNSFSAASGVNSFDTDYHDGSVWGAVGTQTVESMGAVTGDLDATDGADEAQMVGGPVVSGAMDADEEGSDEANFVGEAIIIGSADMQEEGADSFEATGEIPIEGSFEVTEEGYDTAQFLGDGSVSGAMDAAEEGADEAAISGFVLVSGVLSAAEEGADEAEAVGESIVVGVLAATEPLPDTLTVTGSILVDGVLAAIENTADRARIRGDGVGPTPSPGGAAHALVATKRRLIRRITRRARR